MKFIVFIFLLTAFSSPLTASPRNYSLDSGSTRVEFKADSTFHSFDGFSRRVEAEEISFDPESGFFMSPRRVVIPVAGLDTANFKRDANMFKMFERKIFPDIVWNAVSTDCEPGGKRLWQCEQKGNLSVHGISREYILSLSVVESDDHNLSADGEIDLSLHDFKLKPPSVLGLIKVNDRVRVYLKTFWKPK